MIIGKTRFLYDGREYRLTGFLFTYYSNKGENLKFVSCQEKDANSVSGVGVAGVIAPLSEIEILDREVSHDFFLRGIEKNHLEAEEEIQLAFLMSLKTKMSQRSFKGVMTKRFNRKFNNWLKNND